MAKWFGDTLWKLSVIWYFELCHIIIFSIYLMYITSHFILVQLLHFEIASFPSVQNTTSRVGFYISVLCGRKSCFCFKKDYFIWFHSLTVLAKDLNVVSSPHNKYFIVCWFIMHTLYQKYIIKIFRGAIVKCINGADNFNVWKICRIYINTCVNCWFCVLLWFSQI